ncbi:hypothetical protein FIBSPDRAFT_859044, partial [Athelia psychrophila]
MPWARQLSLTIGLLIAFGASIGGGLTKFNSFPFRLVCLRRPSPFRRVASGTPGVCYG